MNSKKSFFFLLPLVFTLAAFVLDGHQVEAGPIAAGSAVAFCYTACNSGYCTCMAGAGLSAGMAGPLAFVAGAACSAAQAACMSTCTATGLSLLAAPTP
jgi:hypothetical protein